MSLWLSYTLYALILSYHLSTFLPLLTMGSCGNLEFWGFFFLETLEIFANVGDQSFWANLVLLFVIEKIPFLLEVAFILSFAFHV